MGHSVEKVPTANALQLEVARRRTTRSGLILAKFIQHMPTIRYIHVPKPAFEVSTIILTWSDPDFLKESNNLAIRRRSHAVILTFDHLTLNICSTWGVV